VKDIVYKGSILKKLTFMTLNIVFLVTAVIYGSFVTWYANTQHEMGLKQADTIAKVISQDLAKLALLNDISAAADITTKLQSFPNLITLTLYDKSNKPIYQYAKDDKSFKAEKLTDKFQSYVDGGVFTVYKEAEYLDTKLGKIILKIDIETIAEIIKKDILYILASFLLTLILSYFLTKKVAKDFTEPIRNLVGFLESIEFNSFVIDKRITIGEKNEFGKLYSEINTMLDKIEEASKELSIAAVAFEIENALMITDKNKKVIKVNNAYRDITGYEEEDVVGKSPPFLKKVITKDGFVAKKLDIYNYWSGEIDYYKKDGVRIPIHLTIQEVKDAKDEISHYVISFIDISQQKEAEEKLKYLKQYDPLTGLGNKDLLLETIQNDTGFNKEYSYGAIFLIDINNFKIINDAYGYEIGDKLLKEVSLRLKNEFEDCDFIARTGISKFALYFNQYIYKIENFLVKAKMLTEHLVLACEKDYNVEDKNIKISVNVGINIFELNSGDIKESYEHTENALYLAKIRDIKYLFFDKNLQVEAQKQATLYTELLNAIANEELTLFYQLQFTDEKVAFGAEALIRWMHPKLGLLSPDKFIPLAEKTGLILQIDNWVLEAGCRQLADWQQNEITKDWSLAINVSAKAFAQNDFAKIVKSAVSKYDIEPSRLKIELVESILIDNLNDAILKIKELQKLGVKISLDDFGTGYSSLQYIKILPINQVKIDQSFVFDITKNSKDLAIIDAVLLLGKAYGFEVIVEGVESKEHFEILKGIGCRYHQGYYLAKPQDIETINQMLKESN
jgi:diguanylate cyclase (GGDEF)-like protein/PAS domain S-box-containing protein